METTKWLKISRKRRERGHGREGCGERNGKEKDVFINKCAAALFDTKFVMPGMLKSFKQGVTIGLLGVLRKF